MDETIPYILTAFANSVPTNHLRSLDLEISGCHYWDINPPLRELLGPILHLRELRDFRFSTEELAPSIEDADIEALVSAWPQLKHLSLKGVDCLDSYPPDCYVDAISIHALHYIHTHCHNLEELVVRDIRCPAVGVDLIPAPLDRPSPHPLRSLFIYNRPVPAFECGRVSDEAAEALAEYLQELFPAVNSEQSKDVGVPDQLTSSAYRKFFPDE